MLNQSSKILQSLFFWKIQELESHKVRMILSIYIFIFQHTRIISLTSALDVQEFQKFISLRSASSNSREEHKNTRKKEGGKKSPTFLVEELAPPSSNQPGRIKPKTHYYLLGGACLYISQGPRAGAARNVFVHFTHRLILFAHDVILFIQRVLLE